MKKSRLVVFVITVLTILTLIVTCTPSVRKNMKLGLDLQGGFEILYEVSPLEGKKLPSMTAVAKSVEKRVEFWVSMNRKSQWKATIVSVCSSPVLKMPIRQEGSSLQPPI